MTPPQNIDTNRREKTSRLPCSTCQTFQPHVKRQGSQGGYWACLTCERREMDSLAAREKES
jgi:hypothetical protein